MHGQTLRFDKLSSCAASLQTVLIENPGETFGFKMCVTFFDRFPDLAAPDKLRSAFRPDFCRLADL